MMTARNAGAGAGVRQATPFVAVLMALLLAYRSPPAGVADTPLLAAAKVGDVNAARAALDGGAWREQYLRRYAVRQRVSYASHARGVRGVPCAARWRVHHRVCV
jgi:hypothetical protein